ncbi:MAG TPA: class I SAM-dependent methyltransferase family protein, partial [Candidatus Thermoplasmatota archaeon]|nr:class I SAM-dependent methyltransferase family protein [Candidatus Thermoplasmatota archaeon]
MPRAPALRVPRTEAEALRRALIAEARLRTDLKPRREGDEVVFPVTDALPEEEFEAGGQAPRTYREMLDLPADLAALLPSSFDVVGHVLLLKLPEPLLPHARSIADALLAANPPVRTVALDRGVKGEFRVRDLEVVAGERSTRTVHVEHGVRLVVDPATAYFSPRLATERARVAAHVRPGERVADLFAGVGPFAIVLAKLARPARVDAVEWNPSAAQMLRENVRRNRVDGVVVPHEDDARAWASRGENGGRFDRVVMNLPHGAHAFLEAAFGLVGEAGVVHHHVIASEAGLARHLDEVEARARAV